MGFPLNHKKLNFQQGSRKQPRKEKKDSAVSSLDLETRAQLDIYPTRIEKAKACHGLPFRKVTFNFAFRPE